MLLRKLACPSCEAGLKVDDELPAGKIIKCPKCGTPFPIPGDNGRSSATKKAVTRARKPAPPPEEEEYPDEEVEERPVRRKRRKKIKKASSNLPLIIGGVVLLLGVGAAVTLAVIFLRPSSKKTDQVAQNNPSNPGPVNPAPGTGPGPGQVGPGPGMRRGNGQGREGRQGRPRGPGPGAETGGQPVEPGPSGKQPDQFAAGIRVFENRCSRCHTIGGAGDGSGGGGGRARKRDLSRFGADPNHTVDWIAEFIRNPGSKKPGSRMPAFEGKLSAEDLRAVSEYLASLR